MWWLDNLTETPDSLYWIQTKLEPVTPGSASVVDYFLLSEQILQETDADRAWPGLRRWTGVYGVPVNTEDAQMPSHDLKIALLRSGRDYADFATTRNAPERREPLSNVAGAIGIVAGISVDSTRVYVY